MHFFPFEIFSTWKSNCILCWFILFIRFYVYYLSIYLSIRPFFHTQSFVCSFVRSCSLFSTIFHFSLQHFYIAILAYPLSLFSRSLLVRYVFITHFYMRLVNIVYILLCTLKMRFSFRKMGKNVPFHSVSLGVAPTSNMQYNSYCTLHNVYTHNATFSQQFDCDII